MKIIVVRENFASGDCNDCGYSGQEVDVYDEISSLLASLNNEEKLQFKELGWRNVKELIDKAEKMVLEKEFYIVINGNNYHKINIDNIEPYDVTALVNGAMLMQKVTPKGVLSDAEYKKYQKAQDRKEKESKAKAKINKERREKKLKKQLEKAKKLLEKYEK